MQRSVKRFVKYLVCLEDMQTKPYTRSKDKLEFRCYKYLYLKPVLRNLAPILVVTDRPNIGAKFLRLVTKHFGNDHPHKKIFNKNSVKISYCCEPNLKTIINGHNKKLLDSNDQPDLKCNCRVTSACPVEGKCQTKNVIYRASVISDNIEKYYVGSTSRSFKKDIKNTKHLSLMI